MNLRRAALIVWVTQGLVLLLNVFGILRNIDYMSPSERIRGSLFLLPTAALVMFFFILWMELKKR
jgi:hypothetical protein